MNKLCQRIQICNFFRKTTIVAIVCVSNFANAQIVDLLTPIDDSAAGVAEERNQHFVNHSKYWSKRTNLVRVNWAVLFDEASEVIRLQLFPDTTVLAKVERVQVLHGGNEIVWEGSITKPSVDRASLLSEGASQHEIDDFVNRVSKVKISGAKVVFDPRARRKYQYFDPAVSEAERNPIAGRNFQSAFEVSASFFLIDPSNPRNPPRQYAIRPFDQEPDFHIVSEVDHSKMYTPEMYDHDRPASEIEKESAYKEYMQTLGEDPKTRSARPEGNQ